MNEAKAGAFFYPIYQQWKIPCELLSSNWTEKPCWGLYFKKRVPYVCLQYPKLLMENTYFLSKSYFYFSASFSLMMLQFTQQTFKFQSTFGNSKWISFSHVYFCLQTRMLLCQYHSYIYQKNGINAYLKFICLSRCLFICLYVQQGYNLLKHKIEQKSWRDGSTVKCR